MSRLTQSLKFSAVLNDNSYFLQQKLIKIFEVISFYITLIILTI